MLVKSEKGKERAFSLQKRARNKLEMFFQKQPATLLNKRL